MTGTGHKIRKGMMAPIILLTVHIALSFVSVERWVVFESIIADLNIHSFGLSQEVKAKHATKYFWT